MLWNRFFGAAVAALAIPAAFTCSAQAAPAEIGRGAELYKISCIACHGENGEGKRELNSPALHQQEEWYIAAQLKKFRAGHRGSDIGDVTGAQMRPMAVALPDDQACLDIASYIVTMDGPPPTHEMTGNAAAGKAMYMVCSACHGEDGMGKVELNTPALVGQADWYIAAQLEKFKQGVRGATPEDVTGSQMRAMALTLATDQAVQDVIAYIVSMEQGADTAVTAATQ